MKDFAQKNMIYAKKIEQAAGYSAASIIHWIFLNKHCTKITVGYISRGGSRVYPVYPWIQSTY